MKPKFKIGDRVKVINYGHLIWSSYPNPRWVLHSRHYTGISTTGKRLYYNMYDMSPELVGRIGVVSDISNNTYAIEGIPGKCAWYNEDQLRKLTIIEKFILWISGIGTQKQLGE